MQSKISDSRFFSSSKLDVNAKCKRSWHCSVTNNKKAKEETEHRIIDATSNLRNCCWHGCRCKCGTGPRSVAIGCFCRYHHNRHFTIANRYHHCHTYTLTLTLKLTLTRSHSSCQTNIYIPPSLELFCSSLQSQVNTPSSQHTDTQASNLSRCASQSSPLSSPSKLPHPPLSPTLPPSATEIAASAAPNAGKASSSNPIVCWYFNGLRVICVGDE